jgi:hypothetical protein
LIESKLDVIERAIDNPEELRALEVKLGIVSQIREVLTTS